MDDLSAIPLVALSVVTKVHISNLLNPFRWWTTSDGLLRDWRGLVDWFDVNVATAFLARSNDPTGEVLKILERRNVRLNWNDFIFALSTIGRWDVIDEAQPLFEKDAEEYFQRLEMFKTPPEEIGTDIEYDILTVDDNISVSSSSTPYVYDAFVLYAEEDVDFVIQITDYLEKMHSFKLCIKERDLLPGHPFEHLAISHVITERCNKLIVIISPNFLKSSENEWLLNYAQGMGIKTRRKRKIIACLYQKCVIPNQLMCMSILDYTRGPTPYKNCWFMLLSSMKRHEKKAEEKSSTDSATTQLPLPTLPTLPTPPTACCELNPAEVKNEPLNLPAVDDLSSVDTAQSTQDEKSPKPKRKMNLIRTCVRKVRSTLSQS